MIRVGLIQNIKNYKMQQNTLNANQICTYFSVVVVFVI